MFRCVGRIYREGKANVLTLNPETLKYRIVSPDGTVWQSKVTSGSEAEGGVVPVQSLPDGLYLLVISSYLFDAKDNIAKSGLISPSNPV